jgi:hypothetical protein
MFVVLQALLIVAEILVLIAVLVLTIVGIGKLRAWKAPEPLLELKAEPLVSTAAITPDAAHTAAQRLDYIVPIAVDAVESRKLVNKVGKGDEALTAACRIANEYLAGCGVSLPPGTVEARIEAEVLRSYNSGKISPPHSGA